MRPCLRNKMGGDYWGDGPVGKVLAMKRMRTKVQNPSADKKLGAATPGRH